MKKEAVKEILDKMPSEFDIEDLVEKLIFLQKVEVGLQEPNEGKIIALTEVKNKFEQKWAVPRSN
jgi:nitrate reductase NapAB chaperone NapD